MSNENLSVSPPPSKELSDEVLTEYTYHGKPVYYKVIDTTTPSNASRTCVYPLDLSKIQVVSYSGFYESRNSTWKIVPINYNDNANFCLTTMGSDGISIVMTFADGFSCPCHITIYYTKK